MSLPPAPHLTEPQPTDVTEESLEAWSRAASYGFHEEFHAESLDVDRKVFELDRSYGHTVDGRWVSTFGALTRRLQVPGGADVDVAAVTMVTVHAPYRRRGLLSAMMRRQLEDCVARGEPLAVLWASESVIYGRYGFGPAVPRRLVRGRTRRLAFRPEVPTSGSVAEVTLEDLEPVARRLHPALRTPGTMARDDDTGWLFPFHDLEHFRDGATALRAAVHYDEAGEPDGFATFRVKDASEATAPDSEVRVGELWGEGAAYAGLWRHLLDLDLVRRFRYSNLEADGVLPWLLVDQRAADTRLSDGLFVRVVDVAAALRARAYAAPVDVVIEVDDPVLPDNSGRWRLTTDGTTTSVERTDDPADLALDVRELGTVYLGGVALGELHRAGRVVEHTPGAVVAASAALGWHRAPWCPDFF